MSSTKTIVQLWADAGRPPRVVAGAPWTPGEALRTMMFRSVWLPQFHGVFRRERAVGARLFIRPTSGNVEPDLYWVFAWVFWGVPLRAGLPVSEAPASAPTPASAGEPAARATCWTGSPCRTVICETSRPAASIGCVPCHCCSFGDPCARSDGSLQNWRWPSEERRVRAKRVAERVLFGDPQAD